MPISNHIWLPTKNETSETTARNLKLLDAWFPATVVLFIMKRQYSMIHPWTHHIKQLYVVFLQSHSLWVTLYGLIRCG